MTTRIIVHANYAYFIMISFFGLNNMDFKILTLPLQHTTSSYAEYCFNFFENLKMEKKNLFFLITIAYSLGASMGMTMEDNGQSVNASSDGLKKLSRRKRYMAFPEGSSFSVRILVFVRFYNLI